MFERYSNPARRVIVRAQEHARMLGHNVIGPEHLLLGLAHEEGGYAALVLESLGAGPAELGPAVQKMVGLGSHSPNGHIPFTPDTKEVLEGALREALALGSRSVETEHLLLALVRRENTAGHILGARFGIDPAHLRRCALDVIADPSAPLPRIAPPAPLNPDPDADRSRVVIRASDLDRTRALYSALHLDGLDLVAAGDLPPTSGLELRLAATDPDAAIRRLADRGFDTEPAENGIPGGLVTDPDGNRIVIRPRTGTSPAA